jgi:CheY-like chemotaxis protein
MVTAIDAKKQLVLVVEDNPSVRDVAAAMIEEMGFEVITASDGHEGSETHHRTQVTSTSCCPTSSWPAA